MGPPRKISKILSFFGFFRPTQKMGPEGPKWGREGLFPAKKNIADILGRTNFDFENFQFLNFLEALNLWVRCRRRLFFSEKMAPRFPDAAGGAAGAGAGRTLRSQPDPSPNAPRDQIRRKDPCCDRKLHPSG